MESAFGKDYLHQGQAHKYSKIWGLPSKSVHLLHFMVVWQHGGVTAKLTTVHRITSIVITFASLKLLLFGNHTNNVFFPVTEIRNSWIYYLCTLLWKGKPDHLSVVRSEKKNCLKVQNIESVVFFGKHSKINNLNKEVFD